ncbi:TIM18 (YOR297C) [Zygosaccharomyces parabailii]|uniref:Succinate dehydrogenase [ubiquinone] cytochrome b small subunit n=1 Tax=Zygosaccharomyces bailii (strain CLIB 213 / ATCC 58445 / CBS 680 / BCRC 21525 / NBRC 1098 / NCYC 1416 / NRRL Y-2227) TaxID=1333698 RepID=A0A8J2WXS5_ZYGB2|nr:TIM18 (YOR297C) [Zygosaccharomyces parabailii]CDF88765.1 ZYBA0S03-01442g1_1 [Zygosaccharomyces bailii CLIB 213]CDH15855.1 related to Succinate dehydrogenase [ubiquinone] cytochrome b small subunit, mitochondrial [Zygosaccharomyces bailii ISA1307]SJM82732.1 related to Succinate dehydrogenase [ubiquinone] cytochrome b small subunit, mitochondrial [Zygosaccharomyces bailii]
MVVLLRPGLRISSVSPFKIGFNAFLRRQTRYISLKPDFSKFKLTPPPPGGVEGTVNDAYKPPLDDPSEGSYHWDYERILAVSLLPLVTVPLYIGITGGVVPPLLDVSLSAALLFHVHYGLTSCIIDYIPKRKFGVWHKLAIYSLYTGTAVGLYGIYQMEVENNGLVDLVGRLWTGDHSNVKIFGR